MIKFKPPQKIIVAFAVLTVVAIGIFIFTRHRNSDSQSGQSPESKAAEKNDVNTKKEEITNNQNSNTVAPNAEKPAEQIPTQQNVAASITTLAQANGNVSAAGVITGSNTAGTCTFDFTTPNDKPVSQSIKGVVDGDHVNCGPISISEVSFSYLGDWTAKLTYYMDSGKSAAAERTINIK